jgi:hypothetical protein
LEEESSAAEVAVAVAVEAEALETPADWDTDFERIHHFEGCPVEAAIEAGTLAAVFGNSRCESYEALAPGRTLSDGTQVPPRWMKVVRCIQCGGDGKPKERKEQPYG